MIELTSIQCSFLQPQSPPRYGFGTRRMPFKPTSVMWGGIMWLSLETTPKSITVVGNFVFFTMGTSLLFVAIQICIWFCWIGRELELYSVAKLISLVEHCVTLGHNRRLLSLLEFVHNWPTSRWSATEKENRFSLNENGIMSPFLGGQFYRSILYYISFIKKLYSANTVKQYEYAIVQK